VKVVIYFIYLLAPYLASAQTYSEQFEKCTKLFVSPAQNDDSLYVWRIYQRDSCLSGVTAPIVKTLSLDGQRIDLQKYKGDVLFLYFWGISCQPCVNSIPELNKLTRYFADKKVRFFAFSSNSKQELAAFLKKTPFNFTNIPNGETVATKIFKLTDFIPYTVTIDKNGKIFKISFGSLETETFKIYAQEILTCLEN